MARLRTVHRCTECGGAAPRWSGRCGGCGGWNTLVEEAERVVAGSAAAAGNGARPVPVGQVEMAAWASRPTGIGELDRVLGGGLVPGSVTLVGGEPGIGKSTLLLQVLASVAAQGRTTLLVSAEESAQQVRLRAERLGALEPGLWLVAETSLAGVTLAVEQVGPDVMVVDSIQTVADPEVASAPGTVSQVRECASRLVALAKQRGMAVLLVGHVTKEGALAGPRVLEHVVDTVLSFEGERHHSLRLLRAVKHRFGPTGELGLFEMAGAGMVGVADPGALFLADRQAGAPGSVVVPTMEGQRPLLVEVQALVTESQQKVPRRSAQGIDGRRLEVVAAVLTERAGIGLKTYDVYASAVGGVRVTEPAGDLGLALAVASARRNRPVPPDLVACGEVGLAGELRQVGSAQRRLAEAARLGFRRALVPASAPAGPAGMELIRVPTLVEALRLSGVLEAHRQ
jgi:DNA repair protein RadA/Sms